MQVRRRPRETRPGGSSPAASAPRGTRPRGTRPQRTRPRGKGPRMTWSPGSPLQQTRPRGEQPSGGERAGAAGPHRDRPAVRVDVEGLPGRVVGVPVEESLYSCISAVAGGLVWLKSKVAGVLGEGAVDPDDDPPRPSLERFDFG